MNWQVLLSTLFRFLLIASTVAVADSAAATAARSPARTSPHTISLLDKFEAMVVEAKAAMLSDPSATVAKAKLIEEFTLASPQLDDQPLALATARWLQGEALLRLNDIASAQPLIDMAIVEVARRPKPIKLLGDLLLSRGGIATAKPDVASALSDYQRAHDIFVQIKEPRSQAIALLSIASLYREAKDYQKALKYYGQALDRSNADPKLSISIYNNRGNTFNESGKYEEAVHEFREAITVAGDLKSRSLVAQIMRNLARSQLAAGKVGDAEWTIIAGIRLATGASGASARIPFLGVSALAAFQRDRLPKAESLISEAFRGVDLSETPLSARENHETAFKIFQASGKVDRALVHLVALKRLDDKATQLAASTNTALMAARFDYANQDLKIAKLKADELQRNVEFERARARFQQFIFFGILVAALIVTSMLIFGLLTIRRSRNEVRAANVGLAGSNAALQKALAAKTEFLATTSHEIRTPLNGILGMTQVMLADKAQTDTTRDRLQIVHAAGITMRALVDDILDVAKMETGNLTVEQIPMNLRMTMGDVSRLWEEQARAKGIDFRLELTGCPVMIEGDAARLRQIVFNLLSNALKFTEKGAVTLRAEAVGQDVLRIAVSDTGIGIPADKHEEIFESFKQVDAGTTRKFGGTGLGLSICRNLARAMGGDMHVTSVSGEGSTFALTLPLCLAAPEAAVDNGPSVTATGLLIIDRNPISRSMIRAVMEPHAGLICFAGSITEALIAIDASAPAMVLLDDATARAEADPLGAIDKIAQASKTAGAKLALLWADQDKAETRLVKANALIRVIQKPIGGAALVEILYGSGDSVEKEAHRPLASCAA